MRAISYLYEYNGEWIEAFALEGDAMFAEHRGESTSTEVEFDLPDGFNVGVCEGGQAYAFGPRFARMEDGTDITEIGAWRVGRGKKWFLECIAPDDNPRARIWLNVR